MPLAALKAGAKAGGGSVNDGFLAAVLGGFRRYHERARRAGAETIPIGIPISLRSEDDPQGGNRFTGARLDGPLGERDPAARIRAVRRFVLQARAGASLDAVGLAGPLLALVARPRPRRGVGPDDRGQRRSGLQRAGRAHPVYIAGSRITRMYPFGPLPGCAAMITLISHDGTCCIGVNVDPAAVTQPAVLVRGLRAGLDEVTALGRA